MTRCITPACSRKRLPHYSRCDGCLRVLLTRIFGRSADYPVVGSVAA